MSDIASSLQYLSDCSEESLESFELSHLNRASNLRKELSQVAEEWVDAEVSFRLARMLVDRRRVNPRASKPQSPRPVILASPRQFTLRLPFPCDTAATHATTELIAVPSGTPYKRENKKKSAFDDSTGPASDVKESPRATNETPRLTRHGIPRTATNLIAAVPGIEPARTAGTATSVQAATELRALNAIASGPPEMHPNPLGVTTAPSLRFRFGFRAEPPKFA